MDRFFFVFLAVSVFVASEAYIHGDECTNSTTCGGDECCFIEPEFLVMSKKRQLHPVDLPLMPVHVKHDKGVCEKYHLENQPCYPLETANRHCGCSPGTQCQWVSTGPTIGPLTDIRPVHNVHRRSMIYHPDPGSYKCVRK